MDFGLQAHSQSVLVSYDKMSDRCIVIGGQICSNFEYQGLRCVHPVPRNQVQAPDPQSCSQTPAGRKESQSHTHPCKNYTHQDMRALWRRHSTQTGTPGGKRRLRRAHQPSEGYRDGWPLLGHCKSHGQKNSRVINCPWGPAGWSLVSLSVTQ